MEQLQKVVVFYGGIEIILSLYALWKLNKYQKNENFSVMRNCFWRYLVGFLFIMGVFVVHLGFLTGELTVFLPVLVVITLIVCFITVNK